MAHSCPDCDRVCNCDEFEDEGLPCAHDCDPDEVDDLEDHDDLDEGGMVMKSDPCFFVVGQCVRYKPGNGTYGHETAPALFLEGGK